MRHRSGATRPGGRPAYTLLEVLLAATIGVLLLGALYVAVDIHLRHAQIGREVIEQSTLARRLITRMASDLTPNLAAPEPARYRQSNSPPGGAAGQGGATPPAGGTTAGTGTGATTPTATASTPAAATTGGLIQPTFNFTVQGWSDRVIVYATRVPRELLQRPSSPDADPVQVFGDLRRISYWVEPEGSPTAGLHRKELKLLTAETSDDEAFQADEGAEGRPLAEEVRSLAFQYWDGSAWQDTWDGTAVGGDGVTPIGPPLAINITLGVALPGGQAGEPRLKVYSYTVSIPTANGATTQTTGEQP
jgi:hypothetical protein